MMARADVAVGALAIALVLWAAGVCATFVPGRDASRRVSALFALAGSIAIVVAGIAALTIDHLYRLGSWQELGDVTIRLDRVAGFYLLLDGIVAASIALALATRSRSDGQPSLRIAAALLNGLLASVCGILVAANVFLFLICWECMAILFYLGVNLARRDTERAGLWTFGLSKLGTALLLTGFLILYGGTRSFQFSAFAQSGGGMASAARSAAFLLFFIGFGVKIGMAPVQVWLPRAYPRAQTLLTALLASVVFNAGCYGLERTIFEWLGRPPDWWGVVLLIVGGVSAFVGILYAATQTEMRAFLAFSSMENAGIILAGFGVALLGTASGQPVLTGLGLVAALYQITVHACAKALLFIQADGAEIACGATNIERLGGLARTLPGMAALTVIGCLTFAGIPPFGGLMSEWLTLEALMQGFRLTSTAAGVATAIAGSLLALTGGIAIVAFVKLFSITFLGVNRGAPARRRAVSAVVGGAPLAALCLAIGVGAPWLIVLFGHVAAPVAGRDVGGQMNTGWLLQPAFSGFSSIAPTELAIVLPIGAALALALVAATWNRSAGHRRVPVWNAGAVPFSPATQYTALGFTNPLRIVFAKLLLPTREAASDDALLLRGRYVSASRLLIEEFVYAPVVRVALWTNGHVRRIQSGSISLYLLYFLIGLAVVLFVVPLTR